jgi:hypothetical protein
MSRIWASFRSPMNADRVSLRQLRDEVPPVVAGLGHAVQHHRRAGAARPVCRLSGMCAWTRRYLDQIEAARLRFDAQRGTAR